MPATSFGNFTLVWGEIVVLFASLFSKKIEVGKVVPRTAVPRRLPNSRRFIVERLSICYQEKPRRGGLILRYWGTHPQPSREGKPQLASGLLRSRGVHNRIAKSP